MYFQIHELSPTELTVTFYLEDEAVCVLGVEVLPPQDTVVVQIRQLFGEYKEGFCLYYMSLIPKRGRDVEMIEEWVKLCRPEIRRLWNL